MYLLFSYVFFHFTLMRLITSVSFLASGFSIRLVVSVCLVVVSHFPLACQMIMFLCSCCYAASLQVWLRGLPWHHWRQEPANQRAAWERGRIRRRSPEAGKTEGETQVQTLTEETGMTLFIQ